MFEVKVTREKRRGGGEEGVEKKQAEGEEGADEVEVKVILIDIAGEVGME